MSNSLYARLLSELEAISLVDPHSHINPHAPTAESLADILGYHYYTELAHSAGLPREEIEDPELPPREKVARLVPYLECFSNTVQYSWLIEMCQTFFGFDSSEINEDNWQSLYDDAAEVLAEPDWEDKVLKWSNVERVFLTNDFDDPLEGFDTNRYIPCLRTDDLVFHLQTPSVRERLGTTTNVSLKDAASVRDALGVLFDRFTSRGAMACAISLPPDFVPAPVSATDADRALQHVLKTEAPDGPEVGVLSRFVFWTIAEFCAEYKLPFDLMIGVNRGVYPAGVFQGQDLFDKRTSLIAYAELFGAFPEVTFPVSVLTTTSNQELVSYAWIFPNVVTNGHWWYSNIPAYIEADCRARLEAVPQSKQIGYYSDMYKLEFALPKFAMYRRVLATVLAEQFVSGRGWSERRAVELGRLVLRGNVDRVFQT